MFYVLLFLYSCFLFVYDFAVSFFYSCHVFCIMLFCFTALLLVMVMMAIAARWAGRGAAGGRLGVGFIKLLFFVIAGTFSIRVCFMFMLLFFEWLFFFCTSFPLGCGWIEIRGVSKLKREANS